MHYTKKQNSETKIWSLCLINSQSRMKQAYLYVVCDINTHTITMNTTTDEGYNKLDTN